MFSLISIILVILLLLLYNKIYFSVYKEKVVFFKYFKNFLIYTFVIYLVLSFSKYSLSKLIDDNFLQSLLTTYFIIFLVLFFNISTKSYESPTVIIYNFIKKDGDSYKNILRKLKKKKLVEIRIKDLLKQKLLIKKGDKLLLSPLGSKFSNLYLFLKNFYKIKSKG
jgi:hypothetical protein|tara:strand:+ start:754 stop:1251 length:498 start_codon:yes stop_codon:yes gene_type:complete